MRRRGAEVLVLISQKQIDALATEGYADLRFERMPAIAMPPLVSLRTPGFLVRLALSIWRCWRLIGRFKADAVLGMGGFTSLPPLVAARLRGRPGFIHDSNAIPGKANRLSARFAKVVLLGLEPAKKFFPGKDARVVGTPIRTALENGADRAEALAFFGLAEGRKTIIVMGGSQGAQGVNRAAADAAKILDPERFQIVHIAGPADYDEVKAAYEGLAIPHHIAPFCHRMEFAYAAADLAISRAGASSLTELAYFALPSILVPYPHAADDHQTANAKVFTDAGAAVMMRQDDLGEGALAAEIKALLEDESRLDAIREALGKLAAKDASAQICDLIEGIG